MRTTIDYGIDLGTTNSAIARQTGVTTTLLDAADGLLVPSVVHVGADGAVTVGSRAVLRRCADPANVVAEFKRLMGTAETIALRASSRRMSPVQLSAEVLKHLLDRARHDNAGEPVDAAVITIPAMFQLPQCEATREASRLAGLRHAPLLQEPIAAAIASAGSAELRDGYWLIYDLGGGTFDVSLVRSRDGRLQVLDHDGDNHLGGKDFDRVVARKAADVVRAEGRLGEFRRTDPALALAFERLKIEAERVRIALSTTGSETFSVDDVVGTGGPDAVALRFDITRDELEALIRPTIERTVQLCRQVLDRNNIRPSEIRRLVLVGGPTLTPCLTGLLESSLGIEARHHVDPLQAVAVGAAMYAATQRIPAELRAPRAGVSLELSYEPMTNDMRPIVAGRLLGDLPDAEWRVRIAADSNNVSAEAHVRAGGAFAARVELVPHTLNGFALAVLRDGCEVPDLASRFSILHGTTIAKPVLSQSVGVMLADNSVRWYLRKGVVLPARHTVSHATTIALRRGQSADAVNVPLIQGESEHGDRNTPVGILQIRAENLSRDLPAGAEVIVTLTVDEHSTTSAEARVPLLNQTFSEVVKFGLETRSADRIRQQTDDQRSRLAELEKLADDLDAEAGSSGIDTRVEMIEELLEEGGADERNQADQLLRTVTSLIDSVEVKDKETRLAQEFTATDERVRKLLADKSDGRRDQFKALTDEFRAAMSRGDWQLAETKCKAAKDVEWSLLVEEPGFWLGLFEYLSDEVLKGPNAAEARLPIDQGKAAINDNNLQGLIAACYALIRLLPASEQAVLPVAILSHVA